MHGSGPPRADPALEKYRAKRSADRTNEPFGGAGLAGAPAIGEPRLFVCQQHAARRMHWDLRLEMFGVLRSWAVPRGPCFDPAVKRLAVMTEDHPIEYVDFEGIIPDGNYGAGAMIVWDRGTWIPLEPVDDGLRAGKLLFELRGHKLRGVWTLVRTKDADGKGWLLIKKPDGAAHAPDPNQASILSGLTIEELREGVDRAADVRRRLAELDPPRAAVDLDQLQPMLAHVRPTAFSDPDWLFELKYDGYRLLGQRNADAVALRYRSGRSATSAFPEIERTLRALPSHGFVLDGEVVVLDPDARPNFQRLQKRALLVRDRDIAHAMREHPVTLYAFDLLEFEGFDLRGLPLVERKDLLRRLLPTTGAVRYSDHIEGRGEALLEHVRRLGLEGVVGKRRDAPYVPGRSELWQKVRIEQTEDLVVVGYTAPEGNRVGFGALLLGAYIDGELTYVGRAGTGFSDDLLRQLRATLDAKRRTKPACGVHVPIGQATWVEPELVCEVRFRQRTDDGLLRLPVFVRMRDDKAPSDCTLPPWGDSNAVERMEDAPDPEPPPPEEPKTASDRREVVVTNPDKLFWPHDGYTKRDLVEFYRRVSPWLLPYLQDRPLVLTRYPDGIEGKSFFQKNAPPYTPDWIRTKTMWSEHAEREIQYFVCDDVDQLVYVANLATIPLHVWGSRLADLQHPDWCILDLDPKGAPFEHVIRIARTIKELCDEIELPCFVKTTGSTGLHVLLPLGGAFTFEQCRSFGQVLGQVVMSRVPDIATLQRNPRSRQGKVYIDYVQNGHGRLLVSPLCIRPLPGAPVSTPLQWSEVGEGLDNRRFTIANVIDRLLEQDRDPLLGVLSERPDLHRVLERLLSRV